MSELKPGIYQCIPPAEYRKWPALAHSDLAGWASSEPPPTGRHLLVGEALHTVALEPEEAGKRFATLDKDVKLNTKAGRAYLEKAEKETGKRIIRPGERADIAGMLRGIRQHPVGVRILEARGEVELCVVATLDGVLCKGRIDKVVVGKKSQRFLADIKTTACENEQQFRDSIYKFNYDAQAAFYRSLWAAANGGEWLRWVWLCVSRRTYECWVVEQTPEQFATGERHYKALLNLYSRWVAKHPEEAIYHAA